ncbi:hypothetical protein QEV08_01630 [Trueperella pyogenes]|uniref:hypothetical protein n=1 Tax=Trueperella pyogenes TaxID=1661 RepID=UPI003251D53F
MTLMTTERRRHGVDRLMTALIVGTFVVAVVPLISLLWTVLVQGWARMSAGGFFTATTFGQSLEGSVTGAGHAVVGTLLITGTAALIAVPLGVLTAVYLVEYGTGKLKRTITFMVDIMTGIPSIVAGLFAAAMIPPDQPGDIRSSTVQERLCGSHRARRPHDADRRAQH